MPCEHHKHLISEYNEDGIWIISFAKDVNEVILGEECNIVFRKKDGKVLRIWFGE